MLNKMSEHLRGTLAILLLVVGAMMFLTSSSQYSTAHPANAEYPADRNAEALISALNQLRDENSGAETNAADGMEIDAKSSGSALIGEASRDTAEETTTEAKSRSMTGHGKSMTSQGAVEGELKISEAEDSHSTGHSASSLET